MNKAATQIPCTTHAKADDGTMHCLAVDMATRTRTKAIPNYVHRKVSFTFHAVSLATQINVPPQVGVARLPNGLRLGGANLVGRLGPLCLLRPKATVVNLQLDIIVVVHRSCASRTFVRRYVRLVSPPHSGLVFAPAANEAAGFGRLANGEDAQGAATEHTNKITPAIVIIQLTTTTVATTADPNCHQSVRRLCVVL